MVSRVATNLRGLGAVALGLTLPLMQNRAGAVTRAGTEIRTQSVATYLDADSRLQTATSNEVINETGSRSSPTAVPVSSRSSTRVRPPSTR
jgi:hypothetical protein